MYLSSVIGNQETGIRRRNLLKDIKSCLDPSMPNSNFTAIKEALPCKNVALNIKKSKWSLSPSWDSCLIKSLSDTETHTCRWGLQHLWRYGSMHNSYYQTQTWMVSRFPALKENPGYLHRQWWSFGDWRCGSSSRVPAFKWKALSSNPHPTKQTNNNNNNKNQSFGEAQ
jgi:hypothetical protein